MTTTIYNYNNPYCGARNFCGLAVKGLIRNSYSIGKELTRKDCLQAN